ncbi:MAG: phosphoglycerate dehydrogenase [Bdellovibrionales bacterium]|nr:phosphoglycerate dehydrogenase [Bdellovibrionales bacterium]
MARILVTDTFTGEALASLRAAFPNDLKVSLSPLPEAQDLMDVEYLLIRSRTQINEALLDQARKLRLIVTATSGFDHIDLSLCRSRQVQVASTPEANASSVAELTFGLLIGLFRQLNHMKPLLKNNQWKDALAWGEELQGQHLGIVGLGRIGSRVAQIAQVFGMHVSALDPYVGDEVFTRLGVERLGLMEILMSSDILTLHVPYNQETHHLINHHTLPHLSPECILVNTSRGAVVAETELIEALELKQLRGACLDVFEREPVGHTSKLLTLPNVVVSCHVGAYTKQAFGRASAEAVAKVIHFDRTGECLDPIPEPPAPR